MKQQRTVLGFLIAAIGLALLGCANPAAGSAVSVTSGENNGVNNVENNVVANGLSYSVTYSDYNSTGGTPPAAQTKVNGTSLILAANSGSLVRTGYTFTGWNTAKDGTGTPYAEGASYTANTAVTLYAMWTINTYSVNYSTIGSTSGTAPAAQTKTHGIGLTLATNSGSLVRTGYTFAGWNTAANGSGTAYAVGASYSADAAVTLFATWTINTYGVTYDANSPTSGTAPASQTKTHGIDLTLAANSGSLVRTGYTFTGWNTAANGSGTAYAVGASYSANTAVTLYAMWTINTYSVTYSDTGADSGTAPAAQTKTHGTGLTLATNSGSLLRTGYTFAGWNTAANGSGTPYAAGGSYTANTAVTLYATWTALLDTGFTVITTPVLHTVTISGSPTLHYGTLASFTSSYNGTAASYAWYMDTYTATPKGSASSLSFTPGVATDTYGSHVLMLVVTDANGLSYSGSIQISVQN